MNLKDFLSSRDKPPELYWSLVLEPGWVQAGVWYIGEAAEVLTISPPAAWTSEDELIGAADAALSSSVQKLPDNYTEPNKTVFAVSSAWVKDGEIDATHLNWIKKICTELSLTPVGFVVLPEGIAHYFKSIEGTPLNAIIVGLGSEFLEVSVFKLGNLVGSTTVSRSVSLIEDVTEGLARFEGAAPLPSRIIIFDGKGGELDEAKEILMQADWNEGKVKFLHTPNVEILPSDQKVIATSLAGAAELGHVTKVSAEATKEEEIPEEVENVTTPARDLTPEDLGFSVGKDVSEGNPPPPPPPVEPPKVFAAPVASKINVFEKTKSLFHGFSGKIIPKVEVPKKSITPILAAIFVLLLLGIAYWWFVPMAKVTIYVSPKKFSQDINVTFSPSGESDAANNIVPVQALTAQVSGDKTISTTGSKLVGDKAKGSISLLNFTQNVVNLSAGTILVSSENLRFTTDSEASISGEVINGSNNVPGTANVNVTAADIGNQYNLGSGEIFTVGNFSKFNLRAQAVANLSGGSSQQITAVSQDDLKNLETSLKNELTQNASDQLSGKVNSDQIFVNSLSDVATSSETFDHQVGEPASSLKLNLSLNTTGLAADKAKLVDLAKGILTSQIPSGYSLTDNDINFSFTFMAKNGNNYGYKVTVSANFLPKVDSTSVINQITGKTPTVAETFLESIPGFSRAAVDLKPHLPGFFGTLPQISNHITVSVAAE